MNETVNKFLLVGDKFIPEIHLKPTGFTYSACGPFTKNKERIEKFIQTGNTNYIYKNDLDKACFQHDMAYGKYKNLTKRTQSIKVLRDKAFEIASNPKYDGYETGSASMILSFFIKILLAVVEIQYQINNNLKMNFINQLLENLNEQEFIHHLKKIFGVYI